MLDTLTMQCLKVIANNTTVVASEERCSEILNIKIQRNLSLADKVERIDF